MSTESGAETLGDNSQQSGDSTLARLVAKGVVSKDLLPSSAVPGDEQTEQAHPAKKAAAKKAASRRPTEKPSSASTTGSDKPRVPTNLTDEQKAEIIRLRDNGVSRPDMISSTSYTKKQIEIVIAEELKRRRELGEDTRPANPIQRSQRTNTEDPRRQRAIDLDVQGVSIEEIARDLGVSYRTARRLLQPPETVGKTRRTKKASAQLRVDIQTDATTGMSFQKLLQKYGEGSGVEHPLKAPQLTKILDSLGITVPGQMKKKD